jgi:hypothetical protein
VTDKSGKYCKECHYFPYPEESPWTDIGSSIRNLGVDDEDEAIALYGKEEEPTL